jgi:hypothetical protein
MHLDRRRVRLGAAALSAAMAVIYLLIGLGVLDISADPSGEVDLFGFGLGAGALFLTGALLLVAVDHRVLWAIGLVLQGLVIAMYLAVSPQREPPYELWGITLRILQLPLIAALAYLAIAPAHAGAETREGTAGAPLPHGGDLP